MNSFCSKCKIPGEDSSNKPSDVCNETLHENFYVCTTKLLACKDSFRYLIVSCSVCLNESMLFFHFKSEETWCLQNGLTGFANKEERSKWNDGKWGRAKMGGTNSFLSNVKDPSREADWLLDQTISHNNMRNYSYAPFFNLYCGTLKYKSFWVNWSYS